MTTGEFYKLIKEDPSLHTGQPLLKAFMNTYMIHRYNPKDENSIEAMFRIVMDISKNLPEPLFLKLTKLNDGLSNGVISLELDPIEMPPTPVGKIAAEVSATNDISPPPILTQARSLADTALKYASSRFRNATEEEYNERLAICNSCEFWKADALLGMGRCLKCGCSGAKLHVAVAKCPIDKWLPITSAMAPDEVVD